MVVSVTTVAVLAAGGFAVTGLPRPGAQGAQQSRTALPPATTSIEQGDLVSSTSVSGTIEFTGQSKINAGAAGTVTWISGAGSTIGRDGRLYSVNGKDVRLMYGSEPMYRSLKSGDTGTDVQQVKENLRALGYGSELADDDRFTPGTTEAVKAWQKAHSLARTGTIGPDQIAFSSGPVRVASADAAVGDLTAPGQKVLTTTGSDRVVHMQVKVTDAALCRPDAKVPVQLDDGTTVPGTITSVGTVAKASSDPNDPTQRIDVTVAFDKPDRVKAVDGSPATVQLTGETRRNVLSVPVSALLALAGGWFGVQVVENGRTREVKVTLGMFAQGRVEISGSGLHVGMRVGVPST